ncbi:Ig-like domain-containing protein [Leucothrix pacifica]|nr:Ig-like domain-containing protein [Leucothrix pacifica]
MNTSVNLTLRVLWLCVLPLLLLWSNPGFSAQPTAFDSWAKTAKVGGAALYVGISTAELEQVLDDMVAQNVTVVEADSDLSNYQSDAQFELELALMRQVADASHKRGLRVVWYIPALEMITINGANIPNTMAKDHPDWVQLGLDGQQNVFYGGGGQVFWVETDAESAWMSPSSEGYRNYFFSRIAKMAETGIDGVWADVPIYADFGPTKWADFNPAAIARFESDTGMSIPTAEDWNDPAWRRWIHWRHEELARFLTDMTATARAVDPEFVIIAETLPTDYNGGTIYGLDAGFTKSVEGLTAVYEVDTMSNNVGMRNAREDDWISFISALKYSRAATGEKPSWTFTYGVNQDDAQQVMAQALIAGNNPYELKVPEMATTVDPAFRARMFNWSKVNAPYLFESESTANTGILFSSPSRDYVDQFTGLGMFATTDDGGDDLWWAAGEIDSVYQRNYLAEHRGVLKVLVNEHIPFNILVVPDQDELNRYQTVMMPNIEAISDEEANRLRVFVQQGGRLVITGPNPTLLDEYGIARSNYALADLLGFNYGDSVPASNVQSYGSGETYYFADRLGKDYLVNETAAARNSLANAVRGASTITVNASADDNVYMETSRLGQQEIIQFTNFIGLNGSFSVVPTSVSVNYTIPNGETVTGLTVTNPDTTNTTPTTLNYTQSGNQISFNVPLTQYALVVVSLSGAQAPVVNQTPAAGKDNYQTDISTSLDINTSALLANDGDLDAGDTLSIGGVYASSATRGSVTSLGGGNYRYTPPTGFSGSDTLTYTLFDSNGGQANGTIAIKVAPPTGYYHPESVSLTVGGVDSTDLSYFQSVDGDTYDIASVSSGGSRVTDWYVTTTITEDTSAISEIKVLQLGHYSLAGVSQTVYIYNYQSANWELVDTATVGNESNYPAVHTISNNIGNYVSGSKEMRLRVRAELGSGAFDSWTEQIVWEVVPVIVQSNNPPVASSQNVTATENISTSITLSASDADGQSLQYRVVSGPANGQLSGTAPNLQYQPNTDYTGSDSFTFVANDGTTDSAVATINITVVDDGSNNGGYTGGAISNAVSDGSISLDGNLSDWSSVPSLGREAPSIAQANAQVDFIEGWLAHDASNLFIAYLNNGDINTETWWPWQVYLDTDGNTASGYQVNGSLGAEYMLQGSGLFQYAGSGSDWTWNYLGSMAHSVSGAQAEFQIPRSVIGNPETARALFMGRNGVFTGDYSDASRDYYPAAYSLIPMHYGLLHGQYSIYEETGGTLSMKVTASAATGATTLFLDGNYPLQDGQLITYLSYDGEYYTLPITSVSGSTLTLAKPLPAVIGAGQDVWNFYDNGSHPNWFGYRAIADFGLRTLSDQNLNQGRHVLLGDSWFSSSGFEGRLNERLPNASAIINQGISGNTSAQMLARFDADIASQNPDYVWVIGGVNDYFTGVTPEQYSTNVRAIIAKIRSIGAEPIIFDAPVAQLVSGSDEITQISHQYAALMASSDYVEYNLGESAGSGVVLTPVSNVDVLTIDGDLSDWSGLQSFGIDGNDITLANSEADMLEGWMAHNGVYLYVAYRNDGDINTSLTWPWQVFLDTDKSTSTGYQAGNDVGAEFMLQGDGLYQYIGAGSDWSWQYVPGASGVISGDIGEYQIELSALGNPESLHATYIARNGIFTGDYSEAGIDRYPNAGLGYLTYDLGGSNSNPVDTGVMSMDANYTDWISIQSLGRDGDDIAVAGAQADWIEARIAHDIDNLYFFYENDGAINTATWWPWQIYIDTDNNPDTGFKVTGGVGAEFVIEGSVLQQYTGTGTNWSWSSVDTAEAATSTVFAEMRLPRASIGDPAEMRIVYKAVNAAFTGSYAEEGYDYFPSNAATSNSGYFTYSTQ